MAALIAENTIAVTAPQGALRSGRAFAERAMTIVKAVKG